MSGSPQPFEGSFLKVALPQTKNEPFEVFLWSNYNRQIFRSLDYKEWYTSRSCKIKAILKMLSTTNLKELKGEKGD